MQLWKRLAVVVMLLLALNALAWVVWAGPVLFDKPKLSDQTRSLAPIERLELRFDPLPARLKEMGMRWEGIRKTWRQRLETVGYEITSGQGDPLLHLTVQLVTDDEVPDGIAFSESLLIEQPVSMEGIEGELVVPTSVHVITGLESERSLRRSVEGALRQILETFIEQQRAAAATNK